MLNALKKLFGRKKVEEGPSLPLFFQVFRELLDYNNRALDLMADMGEKLGGDYLFDKHYIETIVAQLEEAVYKVIYDLNVIAPQKYMDLFDVFERAKQDIQRELDSRYIIPKGEAVYFLSELTKEMSDYVGEKMATLGELQNRLGLRVPGGFVISTYSFQQFLETNALQEGVHRLNEENWDPLLLEQTAHEIQERILRGTVPYEVKKAIQKALASRENAPVKGWAVRSSAVGEDSRTQSYAGQYATVLNVPPSQIEQAYKQVIASLFSPQALQYRRKAGSNQQITAMAVGCLPMIPSKVSGVIYTADPNGTEEGEEVLLSAAWGLGKLVVDGAGDVDQFKVSKTAPHTILWRHIGKKTQQYRLAEGKGVSLITVPLEKQTVPCLNETFIHQIVEGALRIEKYMKVFQDIEWTIDAEDQLIYLQARPLSFIKKWKMDKSRLIAAAQNYPILMKNQGVIASRGIGAGTVFQVHTDEDARHFPQGAVLVLKHTSPRMSKLVPLASAVVTDMGAVTGHMATICREFRVPTIVDTYSATRVLPSGMEITVDAEENVVYRGIVRELLTAQLIEKTPFEETYEFRLLRKLLKKVSMLNVTDPQANEFDTAHCLTFHDIIRFAHEMAVRQIVRGLRPDQLRSISSLTKLRLPIPLNLTVLDIGGGLRKDSSSQEITLDEIECLPLSILLQSLIAPGVWQSQPVDLDLKGWMSSLTRSPSTETLSTERISTNLAIVSKEYLNLNLGLGYHYNLIDGILSENRNSNYIYFRFFGGVTDAKRRSLRVQLLAQILEQHDFAVENKSDLLIARIKKLEKSLMAEKYQLIGRLIGFTRQLDVRLHNEKDVEVYVDKFLEMERGGPSPIF